MLCPLISVTSDRDLEPTFQTALFTSSILDTLIHSLYLSQVLIISLRCSIPILIIHISKKA
ncbi:hypothetical protein K445DRAFT_322127 [Daldinia sp. EC12]|nr:hypothetical protein K445DRAFT_322127 [Daldinia sp. EC12]